MLLFLVVVPRPAVGQQVCREPPVGIPDSALNYCDPTDPCPSIGECVPDPCSEDGCGIIDKPCENAADCIPDPGCSASEPQPDLGDPAAPTEGSAEWSLGAVVTIPCHNQKVSTPAGPVGTDTGYMTDPYFFGWPVDNTCSQSPQGEFELQMKVGFKDADYRGKLPFRLFRSQIQFDLPDKSKTFPNSKGGGEIGSDCSVQYALEKDALKEKGREWLNTRLESLEVPINGSIAYVPMADGSYLVNLDGGGEAVLQYALPSGSSMLDLGVLTQEQWRFEAAWTAESAALYDVVVMGTGSSHQLSNLL